MVSASKHILLQLRNTLQLLAENEYQLPLSIFSNVSIGQHVRHILEFYVCLTECEGNNLNFDHRNRDHRIETNKNFAIESIDQLLQKVTCLETDRSITLSATLNDNIKTVNTSTHRELLYVIEHAVHHMAIIKMGIMLNFPHLKLPDNFGVAESTIAYRNQCVQ